MADKSTICSASETVKGTPNRYPILAWMAGIMLVCMVSAMIWSALANWKQARELTELESEWAARYSEYARITRERARLEGVEAATGELAGSWRRSIPVGNFLNQCVRRFPKSIAVGKVSLESSYAVAQSHADATVAVEPEQVVHVLIVGRCFATPADVDIMALLNTLQSTPEISSVVESISLTGIQKFTGREDGLQDHTVFALNFTLSPRLLSREQDSP